MYKGMGSFCLLELGHLTSKPQQLSDLDIFRALNSLRWDKNSTGNNALGWIWEVEKCTENPTVNLEVEEGVIMGRNTETF